MSRLGETRTCRRGFATSGEPRRRASRAGTPARARACGFALVELLAAVALLAMLMALAWSGLSTIATSIERAHHGLRGEHLHRAVERLLRERFTHALAQPLPAGTRAGPADAVFLGDSRSMHFVATVDRSNLPGPYEHMLEVRDEQDGLALYIRWRPAAVRWPDADTAADAWSEQRLLGGLKRGEVRFAASFEETPRWRDSWRGEAARQLPARVRLVLTGPRGRGFPPLVLIPGGAAP